MSERTRTAVPSRPHAAVGTSGRGVFLTALAAASVATAALLAVAAVGGAAKAPAFADPGPLTRWGLLVSRVGYDVAAVGTIGALVVAVVLLPSGSGRLGQDAARLVRLSSRWAVAWAATAACCALLGVSDVMGVPVWTVLAPDVLPLVLDVPQTRAMVSSAWLAALVAVWGRWTPSRDAGRLLLLTACGALVPPLLTGHAGHEDDHLLTVSSLSLHVVGAAVWIGGLLAIAVHLRGRTPAMATALPGYSAVALGAFALVAASGVVTGLATLGGANQVLGSDYGRLLMVKAAALVLLGVVGHLQRRRLAAVAAHRPRAFLALAAVELVLMAGTVGLAAGLSRTPPPDPQEHVAAVYLQPAETTTQGGI